MFLFNEFATYTKEQVEHILDCPLVLPEWVRLNYSFADVDAVFLFQSAFAATHDGVIVAIETSTSSHGDTEFSVFEDYLRKNKCNWWANGGDVWELDERGQRLDVVMSLVRMFDHRGCVKVTGHTFTGQDRWLFSNAFYRKIEIDALLAEL